MAEGFDYHRYTIGWICALETELVAARAVLDDNKHDRTGFKRKHNDDNTYCFGSIGKHNIVIAALPHGVYGTNSAAGVARDLLRTFTNVRIAVMVGIGGGAPTIQDVRLGDIVISTPGNGHGGVCQYDFGKDIQDQDFRRTCHLNQPPTSLLTAITDLGADFVLYDHQIDEEIVKILDKFPPLRNKGYARPSDTSDRLYRSSYAHRDEAKSCSEACDVKETVKQPERMSSEAIKIHRGLIGSGNTLMKNAMRRDDLARADGILCFEMEAAGLMNLCPFLAVRGICDYSDSHKNKEWQGYAALTAAVYTKKLLTQLAPSEVETETKLCESLKQGFQQIEQNIDGIRIDLHKYETSSVLRSLPTAKRATYDAETDQGSSFCLEGTRTELIAKLDQWVSDPDGKRIFWLCGVAGTGKSTFSRTIAQKLEACTRLGASFFFKRGEPDRKDARASVTSNGLPVTAEDFIVVVDALDECEHDSSISTVLRLISQTGALPLRVFVTSRPDLPVKLGFRQIGRGHDKDVRLEEFQESTIEHDLRLFFNNSIAKIKVDYNGEDRWDPLPLEWPDTDLVQQLVMLAIPLFIFASTACRYLSHVEPRQGLRNMLDQYNRPSQLKFGPTYLPTLMSILHPDAPGDHKRLLQQFQEIVGTIVLLREPLSAVALANLQLPLHEMDEILRHLYPVLNIPKDDDQPIRPYHLSFADFLTEDPRPDAKDNPFWIDSVATHGELAHRCLERLCRRDGLFKDRCRVKLPATRRTSLTKSQVEEHISTDLAYACKYWPHHLLASDQHLRDGGEVHAFLREHLLHWLEALSWLGMLSYARECINDLVLRAALSDITHKRRPNTYTCKDLTAFLKDSQRFVSYCRFAVDLAPLQVYTSAIMFAPGQSLVRRTFVDENVLQDWAVLPEVFQQWGAEILKLEGHDLTVTGVDFSPCARVIVSGSVDKTIRLWNARTGTEDRALEGHDGPIWGVVFSPDGQVVASGSEDCTVRLWNMRTGTQERVFEGHDDAVMGIAFSADGSLIVSGSRDRTVRLWNARTGVEERRLHGHHGSVCKVAISPDGRIIASGSEDCTVRLWNAQTNMQEWVLEGHDDYISALAFSPHKGRQIIASASLDGTVRLWDRAGVQLQRIEVKVTFHLAFSPDGHFLASGSVDGVVRLWDPTTSAQLQVFKGHKHAIYAVSFSPDGRTLVSAAADSTLRLWDTTRAPLQTLQGHHDKIDVLAFSRDGECVASAGDCTVRLWSTTGAILHTLEGHENFIHMVVFSPSGKLIATGSADCSVRLWSITGTMLRTFDGHGFICTAVAFSPDGHFVILAIEDRKIQVWNAQTYAQEPEALICSDEEYIDRIAFPLGTGRRWFEGNTVFFPWPPHRDVEEVPSQIDTLELSEHWIRLQGKELLWLPHEYRGDCHAVHGRTLVIGQKSGAVSFFGRKEIRSLGASHIQEDSEQSLPTEDRGTKVRAADWTPKDWNVGSDDSFYDKRQSRARARRRKALTASAPLFPGANTEGYNEQLANRSVGPLPPS